MAFRGRRVGAAAAAAAAVALFAVATLERSLSPRAQMLLGVVAYDAYPAYSYPAAREACENQQYPQYPQYPPYPQYPQKMVERQELALPGVIYFPTSAGIEMCINAYLEQVSSCAASSLFLRVVPLSPPCPPPPRLNSRPVRLPIQVASELRGDDDESAHNAVGAPPTARMRQVMLAAADLPKMAMRWDPEVSWRDELSE